MPDNFKYSFPITTSGLTATISAFMAPVAGDTTVRVTPIFSSGLVGGSFNMTAKAGVVYPIKSSNLKPTTNSIIGFN